jgi:hypothetical protein
MAVLGEVRAPRVVHRTAGIGTGDLHLNEGRAVDPHGGRLDDTHDPAVDLRDHGTAQVRDGANADPAVIGRGEFERALGAADARAAERQLGLDEGGFLYGAGGEARPLLRLPPGLVFGHEVLAAGAAASGQQRKTENAKNYAETDGWHAKQLTAVTLTDYESAIFPRCIETSAFRRIYDSGRAEPDESWPNNGAASVIHSWNVATPKSPTDLS